ncbi:uncharacterized protein A4U43_C08F4110 [Asparagus officinalis]|uniref:protein RTF1 homolog n=1 Tax=Asparagus officinalis TaxID=4686 RepID=UPI00098E6A21|nr:protein RTF1 homolog [Asparagus officinalis]ONK59210.1 uncharacterized protein A4U43_C08F4110 [Asparagus officinalis]
MAALTFEDIKAITIPRSKLAKWSTEPFFDKIIAGCFVRLGMGLTRSRRPTYKLCIVRSVDATSPNRRYTFENRRTSKWLNCVWGSDASAARWPMSIVSNGSTLEEEFNELVHEIKWTGGTLPSLKERNEKVELILRVECYSRPPKAVLEEIAKKKRERAERLVEMNKRNRIENFKIASEAKAADVSLKAGDEGYDPFSRRWTRPTIFCKSKSQGQRKVETASAASTANSVSRF